jgi:hypothetical protein
MNVNNCQFDPYNVSYDGTITLSPGNNHSMLTNFAVTTQEINFALKITTEFNLCGYIRTKHSEVFKLKTQRDHARHRSIVTISSSPWQIKAGQANQNEEH